MAIGAAITAAVAVGGAVIKGVSSHMEGQAQQRSLDAQARFERAQGEIGGIEADINAALIGDQIRDVKQVAGSQVRARESLTERQKGAQTAGVAAQGVDVAGGPLEPALAETAVIGAQDAAAIQNNAAREVFGLRTARQNKQFAAQMSRTLGLATARQLENAGDLASTRGSIGLGASLGGAALSVGGSLLARSLRPQFGSDEASFGDGGQTRRKFDDLFGGPRA